MTGSMDGYIIRMQEVGEPISPHHIIRGFGSLIWYTETVADIGTCKV